MEEWFQANHIQEEEKTVVAEETLTDEAFLHWDKDAYERLDYELPDHTWDEMKQLLHQEFVEKTTTEPYYPRPAVPSELRRLITATPTKKVSNPKARKQTSTNLKEKPPKEKVDQKQNPQEEINVSSTTQHQPAAPQQGKCTNSNKFKDLICYRCHKRGHYAVTCPSKKATLLEEKTELSKTSDSLVHSDLLNSNSCMMHLLLSKNVDSGHIMEHKDNEVERSKSVEKQPSETLVSGTYDLIRYWNYSTILRCIKCSVFNDSTSSIIHLILFLSVKRETGCIDLCHKRRETATKKSLTLDPTEKLASRDNMLPYPKHMLCLPATKEREDVTSNFLPQEEPPDQTSSSLAFLNTRNKFTIELDQVSSSLFQFVSNNLNGVIMNLLSTEECEQNMGSLSNQVVDTLCDTLCNTLYGREMDQRKLVLPAYNIVMTAITHLFLAQSVDELAGTNKEHTKHKGDSPEKKRLVHQSQNLSEPAPTLLTPPITETRRVPNVCLIKEEPPDFKTQANIQKGAKQTTPPTNTPYQNRGVILNFLLKGEPPDAPRITKPPQYQGKTLASQTRMKANLLSLGADYIVSRSKLFQGRGYDADIQTTQYRYDGRIKPAAEPKLIQTGGTTPIRPDEDICSLFEAYQLNHDDSRHETTWRLFTAQPQNTTKKNHPKMYYHEEFMGVTIQQFSDASDKDLRSHDESFRPDQEANGNKSNCSRTPTNHKHAAKWNQPIISSHEGDIVFLKQRILHLLYLETHGFWRLQTYHWRPGDFMILLKYSYNILGCTNMHRIKWIKLEPNFPFSDPFDINAERLFPLTLVRLPELYSVHLDIPRHHQYSPKLSRLKHQRLFPYSADTPQSRPTAICIKFDSFVSFFRFLGRCTQLYIS